MGSEMCIRDRHRQVENGFVEVLDGPTGFMVITREAFDKMHEHYKEELDCVNDHQNRDFDDYCAIFDCMIDPENRRYLSEDYSFCRLWQKIGGKIYADIISKKIIYFYLFVLSLIIMNSCSNHNTLSIGHRGAKGYVAENTYESISKAIELGADCLLYTSPSPRDS